MDFYDLDLNDLVLDALDDMNFTEKPEDLRTIIDRVDAEINGLFKQK